MRKGLLGSLAALAASAGLAQAQPPPRLPAAASAAPGRATAGGLADAVPIGASAVDQPAAAPDGGFAAAMQPQYDMGLPGGGGDPRLNTECASTQLDYLLYFVRSQRSNYPLVTASTTAQLGAIGPGSAVLYGMDNINLNPYNGGRFIVDVWKEPNRRLGGEFIGMVTATRTGGFIAGYGTQLIARPVIDANSGQPVSLLVAAPGYARGGVGVNASTQVWGFEANGKFKAYSDANKELTLIGGFRYIDLLERLDIAQQSIFVPGQIASFYGLTVAPAEIDVNDSFHTRNNYYLANLGLQGQWRHNRWSVQGTAKIGLGDAHETSYINGSSTLFLTAGGAPNTVPGGLLATSSNIGTHRTDVFVVVPEGSLQIGYRLFHMTDLVVGYTFTYISRAVRPGSEIDAVVNPVFVPTSQFFSFPFGPRRPAPLLQQVDTWVQGFNFGVNIHF
jgi:hypothetical protein